MSNPKKSHLHTLFPNFHWMRVPLSLYFLLYTYVVARGLVPLPDEPPRINFWGIFCATCGFVIALHFLVGRYRLFLCSVLVFLPIAAWQLSKRIRFLEMMLQPMDLEKVVWYSLGFVGLALLMPSAWAVFDKPLGDYKRSRPLFFNKGIPF